jgi:hypothetical protein
LPDTPTIRTFGAEGIAEMRPHSLASVLRMEESCRVTLTRKGKSGKVIACHYRNDRQR